MDLIILEEFLKQNNLPKFRLKQIKEGFFKQSLSSFDDLTNLPLSLWENLKKSVPWFLINIINIQESKDKESNKYLFELKDKNPIESVLINYRDWQTACVSVMSGCPLNCSFCATGQFGYKRNLTPYEIVDQIVYINHQLLKTGKRISRIVFMGMGEPFLNWDNVWKAVQIINSEEGLFIGQRHITISTAGIIRGINEFTDLDTQINLAISLHTPFQDKREEIMPIAKENPIPQLMEAATNYVNKTKRKLFFEYALINDFNDREEDALELKNILKHPLFHLNLIRLNQTKSKFSSSDEQKLTSFTKRLDILKIPYTIRRSVGPEIGAACGQLAGA